MTVPVAGCDTTRLYRAYAGQVGRWAARLSGSASDADDIVQEVFLTVHRQQGGLAHLRSAPAWLLQITRNVVRHLWRTRARAARRALRHEWVMDSADLPGPLELLERRRAAAQLQAAVRALDERSRQIYWMCEVEELPPAAVAALTGLAPATLRVRRFRARRQLAARLGCRLDRRPPGAR